MNARRKSRPHANRHRLHNHHCRPENLCRRNYRRHRRSCRNRTIGAPGRSGNLARDSMDSCGSSAQESFGSSVRNHVEPNNSARNNSELDDMPAQSYRDLPRRSYCLTAGMTAR